MKDPTNRRLAILLVLSTLLCAVSINFDLRPMLVLPAIPAFCLQRLICRNTDIRFLRAIPLALTLLFLLTGAAIWAISYGWDALLGVIMVCVSIAPAVGCALALFAPALFDRFLRRT